MARNIQISHLRLRSFIYTDFSDIQLINKYEMKEKPT